MVVLLLLLLLSVSCGQEIVSATNSSGNSDTDDYVKSTRSRSVGLDVHNFNNWVKNEGSVLFDPEKLLPVAVANSDKLRTPLCRNQSRLFIQELKNFTLWAVQMFDAAAKFPVGVLAGNQYQMGNFDECTEILVSSKQGDRGVLQGKYCLAEIEFQNLRYKEPAPSNFIYDVYTLQYNPTVSAWEKIKYNGDPSRIRRDVLHWALCVPASCSAADVLAALEDELSNLGEKVGVSFSPRLEPGQCHVMSKSTTLSMGDIAYIVVVGVLLFLLVTSTVYDYTLLSHATEKDPSRDVKPRSSVLEKIFMCFSARQNLNKLTNKSSIQPAIDATHGPRFLFMLLIIMGHRMTSFAGHPIMNAEAEETMFRDVSDMFLANGPLIVDGYFALSGLLLSYPLLLHLGKTNEINVAVPILVRFFRLTPSYLLIVFLHATILPHFGSGPFWDATVGLEQRRCATNWWTNLLYINNYINVENMCMFQSWYVAADFHLYIISLLVVYTIWKWPAFGYTTLVVLTTLSVLIPFMAIYQSCEAPLLYPYPDNIRDVRDSSYFQTMYVATHNRAAPYFVGVIVGIILYKLRNTTYRLPKVAAVGQISSNYILWHISSFSLRDSSLHIITEGADEIPSQIAYLLCVWVFGITVMLSAYVFFIPGRQYDPLEAALYGSLHRIGFATAIAFFFILLTCGQLDFYQKLFSCRLFVVLSRLTYGAYLVHAIGQLYDQGSLRQPRYLSTYIGLWFTLGDITFAFLLALILLLLVEAPFRSIEKIVFGKR